MLVMKFGGTSVGSAARMQAVADLLEAVEGPVLVVLSAMSGTTNALVSIAEALFQKENDLAASLIDQLADKYKETVKQLYSNEALQAEVQLVLDQHFDYMRSFTLDMFTRHEEKAILAQGELISTFLFFKYLEGLNKSAYLMPALDFMRLDADGEPDQNYINQQIIPALEKANGARFIITQGFICRNAFGEIDNLKRGGSDYSASIIGAAINASEIQIWTDIDGMHNNDPRVVKNTKPILNLSFEEASELAYFGAKILHPSSILPAMTSKIPVRLLNTMAPSAKGTLIATSSDQVGIKAVAAKDGITAIKIRSGRMLLAYGFLRNLFEVFEQYKTPIDMITTSEVAVSLTIDNHTYLNEIIEDLKHFGSVEIDQNQTIVCLVGDGIVDTPGIAAKALNALSGVNIRMISFGGSKNNISVLINEKDKQTALMSLQEGIFN